MFLYGKSMKQLEELEKGGLFIGRKEARVRGTSIII